MTTFRVTKQVASGLGLVLLAVALFTGSAQAEPRSLRARLTGMKAELRELRAELAGIKSQQAQLRTTVEYQGRAQGDANRPIIIGGFGGICGDPCSGDADGDGVTDCQDVCPCDPNTGDGDGDGTPDCADPCPDDATNACIDPCRMDSDGDGTNDCEDPCPYDPNEAKDIDSDGIPDCQDPCPDDATNTCFDPCPLDQDGDGVKDCRDICPWVLAPPDGNPPLPCPMPPMAGMAARR